MTSLGAPAIAAACHVQPKTVYWWAGAKARGEYSPIRLRRTRTGRLWCTSIDVHRFFNPPQQRRDRIGLEVEKHLDRLDQFFATRGKGETQRGQNGASHKAAAESPVTGSRQEGPGRTNPILGAQASSTL